MVLSSVDTGCDGGAVNLCGESATGSGRGAKPVYSMSEDAEGNRTDNKELKEIMRTSN
jgi:hypothetical protein